MAGTVEQKLAEQGIKLHEAPTPVANYVPFVRTGNLLFVSGQVCFDPAGRLIAKGKLGAGVSIEDGQHYVGQPADYGKKKQEEYTQKRYHQPSDEVLPSFNYDGARQQLRVIVRTAVAVADASAQPAWNASSEFRKAGEERLKQR